MSKRSQKARVAHTKQKPKPRYVSKAHQLEQNETQTVTESTRTPLKRSH
jgi:hypothetical protein